MDEYPGKQNIPASLGKTDEVKKQITSLDLRFVIKEIRERLSGGVFRKIYQYGSGKSRRFLISIFASGRGEHWLYADAESVFLTKKKQAAPQEPPSFCMFLRKHLMGKKIKDVRQHGFDRIIEISTDSHILIFELFSRGNVILCDSSYNIIMPLEIQRWRHREIRPKVAYKYPPGGENPFSLDFGGFSRLVAGSDKNIVSFLAVNMGFGGIYAREICFRAGIKDETPCGQLSSGQIASIYNTYTALDKEKPEPCVYENAVSPFPLKIYQGMESAGFDSFSDALDEFFSEQKVQKAEEEVKKAEKKETERIERITKKQEEASEKWKKIEQESKEAADSIYKNYSTVQEVIEGLQKARDSGMSWEEIKQKIKSEGSEIADVVKEIREGDAVVVIELDGKDIEIDFRKTPEENAARYYEDAKWARKKYGGAEEAMEKTKKEMERIPEMAEEAAKDAVPEVEKPKIRKRWYETYKWFISSEGFVVIAGKNANQNENLIKNRAKEGDVVLHADIQGAAFVVVKSDGREIGELTLKEAAEFAAANSKAWSRGMGKVDVYAVSPNQVSKTPPSGEYLPKGSFMIYGERIWFRDQEIKLGIGIKIITDEKTGTRMPKVLSGPVMAMRKNSDYFVTINPGYMRSHELARKIKASLLMKAKPEDKELIEKTPIDELQALIPSGMGQIVEGAEHFDYG